MENQNSATPTEFPALRPIVLDPDDPATHKYLRSRYKKCPACSTRQGKPVFYPATTENFNINRSRSDGLSGYCKNCDAIAKARREKGRTPRGVTVSLFRLSDLTDNPPIPPMTKRCKDPVCGRVRPRRPKYFPADKRNIDGYSDYCVRCHIIAAKQDRKLGSELKIHPQDEERKRYGGLTKEDYEETERIRLSHIGQQGFDENGYPY